MAPLSRACESTRNIGGCSKMHRSSNFARLVLTAGFLLCLVASNVSATDGIDDVGREQECDAGGNCSLADDEGKSESDSNCIDLDKECERMEFKCFDPAVMANMLSQCPKTCGACAGSPEIDGSDEELDMRTQICEDTDGTQCSMEECAKNPEFMLLNCKQTCRACVKSTSDFGKPQTIPAGTENEGPIRAVIRESIKYMREIRNNAEYASMWNCKNKLNECSSFASMGGCRQTAELMNEHCAPACQTCHHHYWKVRCPLDPNAVDAIQPGGVDDLFESIISKYKNETAPSPQVQVLSRPLEEDPGPQNGLGYVDGPWVLVIDNFHDFAFTVLYTRAILFKANAVATKSSHHKSIYIDWFFLSDTVSTGDGLIFNGWIPVRRGEVNLLKVLHVESLAGCLNLNNHHVWR